MQKSNFRYGFQLLCGRLAKVHGIEIELWLGSDTFMEEPARENSNGN
jgi:hypothetical protein